MTLEDKLARLARLAAPEELEDEPQAEALLEAAGELVLNRLYPFGYPEGTEVPARYEQLQLRVALELYAKRGAEGETSHTENGLQRVYEAGDVSPSLLGQIVPRCAGVIRP